MSDDKLMVRAIQVAAGVTGKVTGDALVLHVRQLRMMANNAKGFVDIPPWIRRCLTTYSGLLRQWGDKIEKETPENPYAGIMYTDDADSIDEFLSRVYVRHTAYLVQPDGSKLPIDMKGVELNSADAVRKWLFVDQMNPGYMKTHPELAGKQIEVIEDVPIDEEGRPVV